MAYPYPPPGGAGYPPPSGGAGYPPTTGAYPPPVGFGPPGQPLAGYPGFPPTGGPGYPPPAGFPPTGMPPAGGPGFQVPQHPAQAYGAPPMGGIGQPPPTGYPQQPPPVGYPQQAPPTGYPQQPPPAGYPQQAPPTGYPQQAPPTGYPQQAPPTSYPQQAPPTGYAQQPPAGYGQQPPAAGYPASVPPTQQPPPSQPAAKQPPPARPTEPPKIAQVTSQVAAMRVNEEAGHGTIVAPATIDPEADAGVLRKAMKGLGTDEQAIIDLLVNRSNAQRQEIRNRFKLMYGKDLIRELKSELSGNIEELILALMEPSKLYDAKSLRRAIKGAGTDEQCLIEILCSRSNAEIQQIKQAYKEHFTRDLEKDVVGDTGGHFKRLLVSLCQGAREENVAVDMAKAQREAQELYQAGEKKWGTDESKFNQIIAVRSFAQLRATFDAYVRISQRDIVNSIEREMSGDLKRAMVAVVQCVRSRPAFFAERLYKSMKGAGTDDATLVRIVVSRSEVDLVEIKKAFLERYHKTLYKMIEGDTSGDYRKLLKAIVKSDV